MNGSVAAESFVLGDFLHAQGDAIFEETIARNRFSVKYWWSYIEAKRGAPDGVRNLLHERAIKCLPGSYKLWHSYLRDLSKQCRGKCVVDKRYEILNNAYERALVTLHKMPRIWLEYCDSLIAQRKVTTTRRTFDKALRSLPITQHSRIWAPYIKWVTNGGERLKETALCVFSRCLKLEPNRREDFVEYLLKMNNYGKASNQLAMICADDQFVSKSGKTKHALWIELCMLVSKHPANDLNIDVDAVIRSGIHRFSDEVGRLWCCLADYYIRLAMFEKVRDVFEEALETVMTVRDFSVVFYAYAQFEESMLRAKMEMLGDDDDGGGGGDTKNDPDSSNDVDLRIARLSSLMDRRPLLVNAVKLRQNPHNVCEWDERIDMIRALAPEDSNRIVQCFTTALASIDPTKALGKPHELWVKFAKYYEEKESIDDADDTYRRASSQSFRFADDLAAVWCEWAEMHIRLKNYDRAHSIVQQAVGSGGSERGGVHERLQRSKRVWSLYVDLEESLGSLTTARAAYDRMIKLRVATVRHVLNYADLLRENNFFEDSFKVYETGTGMFTWPHVKEIWLTYLTAFVKRYGASNIERARDLFEEAIKSAPHEHAKPLYLLFAQLEEKHGLMRHAMSIFDRATSSLPSEALYDVFCLYLKKAEEYYGVTRTRVIYEKAIDALPRDSVRSVVVQFATMESRLGEIDRARAIYKHGSQFCNPSTVLSFWRTWHDFEVRHGNEDTFREMLRVKRSVEMQCSQASYTTAMV